MDWSTWIQDVGGSVIKTAAQAQYQSPYDVQKLQIQALGEKGYYIEGKTGAIAPATAAQSIGGIPVAYLMIGGAALLAIVLMKS